MKKTLSNLALLGGQPLFAEPVHVGRPNIGDRQRLMMMIDEILDRKWLTNNGPLVQELEKTIAAFLNVRHCILTCNATVALEIAIRALDLKGEVILPSFTFVATAHALEWLGVKPVFCDVDPLTHNIDPSQVIERITPRTSAVIGVHVWGRHCPVDELEAIASRHDIKLVFDAAHAFASSFRGQPVGGFGDLEVFSFHATKFFNTLEGGAITTNNSELANIIHKMKNFGFAGYDSVVSLGINGKMNEIEAAMGLVSLESLDQFISRNFQNYSLYQDYLGQVPGLKMVEFDPREKNNYQYIVFENDESQTGISRDMLVKILHSENILARKYFYPGVHRMEPYRTLYPDTSAHLKHTEALCTRTFCLPNGMQVSNVEIMEICDLIKYLIDHHDTVVKSLSEN